MIGILHSNQESTILILQIILVRKLPYRITICILLSSNQGLTILVLRFKLFCSECSRIDMFLRSSGVDWK
jgi:hypothetical protein